MNVSIIIPIYKEMDNIAEFFTRIFKVFNNNKIGGEIIIVDDDSRDGLIEIVNKFKKKNPVKLIIQKNERGLASAFIEVFKSARENIILLLDADLKYPPEKIPEIINAIKKGADIVIGSRYIEDETYSKGTFGRKIVTNVATALVNILFSDIKDIKDKESGFFAFKKKVIKDIEFKSNGYNILFDILVLGNYNKVREIGFEFGKKSVVNNKLDIGKIFSYISHLIRLLWASRKLEKLFKFCFVGLIGVFVNLFVIYFLTSVGLYYMISGLISIEVSVLINFFINRAWTFKEEAKNVGLVNALIKDHATRFFGILINYVSLFTFTAIFHVYYMISMLIGIIISTLWNFIGNSLWVWKEE